MAEIGIAHGFELLEPVPQRIEGLRVDIEAVRILEDEKGRSVTVDAPRHVFLNEDLSQAGADVLRGRLRSGTNIIALNDRERCNRGRRAQRICIERALMTDLFPSRRLGGGRVKLV